MNEFQAQDMQSELEALSKIKIDFSVAPTQPFVRSIQQDVEMPTWNKLTLPDRNKKSDGGSSTGTLRAITMLNGLLTYVDIDGTPAGLV